MPLPSSVLPPRPFTNFIDYLYWRSDVPICKQSPLNEIDRLVLSRFSYLSFNEIRHGKTETISSLAKKIYKLPDEKYLYLHDRKLAKALSNNHRFGDLLVTNFVSNSDTSTEKQFGAITILLPNHELFISYIGTDDTLYGWKEDFNMAFMDNVPSQLDGAKYLRDVARKYHFRNIRLGGHSKGGNIAVYAALTTKTWLQRRIISVDNFDGPGFDGKRVKLYKNRDILNKILTYLPQGSIIGRLFDHDEPKMIVESIGKGIMQHDVYTWHVEGQHFIEAADVSKANYATSRTIRNWLQHCTIEERQIFVDSIYNALVSASFDKFSSLYSTPFRNIPAFAKAYKNIPDADRKVVAGVVKEFFKAYVKVHVPSKKDPLGS